MQPSYNVLGLCVYTELCYNLDINLPTYISKLLTLCTWNTLLLPIG